MLEDHKYREKYSRVRGGCHQFMLGGRDRFLWKGDIQEGDVSWESMVRLFLRVLLFM